MAPNPQTSLYHLRAKRPFWAARKKELLPGDRTAVRPDREDDPGDRWLILRISLGGNHLGDTRSRAQVFEWEESLLPGLDGHPTAMWDGHEIGCGEFRLRAHTLAKRFVGGVREPLRTYGARPSLGKG